MGSGKDMIDWLLKYLDGRLEPDESEQLERQLAVDSDLRSTLNLVRALKAESAGSELLQAAQGLVERFVRDLAHSPKRGGRGLLTFDSGLLPLPAGIRPATLDSRRLKYAADEVSLELSVYPASPGSFEVIGQVEGYVTGEPLAVTLERGRKVLRDQTNPFHVFHFDRVPEGVYALTLTDQNGRVFEFSLEL